MKLLINTLLIKTLLISTSLLLATSVAAQQTSMTKQDPVAIRAVVEYFLRTQSAGLPGQVSITTSSLDPRSNLAACAAPEPFLPAGSRVWGRTTVGVRCSAPASWTVYISATVNVMAEYLTAAAPLAQGQLISARDLAKVKGDLTLLPAGILTDPSQAIGRTLSLSLPAGSPLRQDALRAQIAVQQGQTVRLVSSGTGFSISSEARALNNASAGQVVQARTAAGQVVSGVAQAGGIVEVSY